MAIESPDRGVPAIALERVRKTYGELVAVRDMALTIPRGATYGLLGPNGAGKTTLIRIALGIIQPDSGSVRVLGAENRTGVLDRVGYLPEERGMYRRMTVRRALSFFAEIKGVGPAESASRIGGWLERFGLADRAESKVQDLSKGNQQKLQLIGTLLHEPEIIVLDEPFSGLDPLNQQVFKDVIAELRQQGRTILFSTHMIEQAERSCDHVCIIARGEKVLDGRVADVKREHGSEAVAIEVEEWTPAAAGMLRSLSEVRELREDGANLEAVLAPAADAQVLLNTLVSAGVRLRRFERKEPSLEQIFIERVRMQPPAKAEEVVHV